MANWVLPDPVVGPLSDAIVDGNGRVHPWFEPFVRWMARRPEEEAQSIAGAFRNGIIPPNVQIWFDRWERETGQS